MSEGTAPSGRLDDKVALVTGASRGIGKGVAVELALAGAVVYCTARTVTGGADTIGTLPETIDEIAGLGGTAIALQCDHSDDEATEAVFARIAADHGRLDVLVNNACGTPEFAEAIGTRFWELPRDSWDSSMDVGLRSNFVCSQLAAPVMVGQGNGLIVNISSHGAVDYLLSVPYGVAKAGVDKLTRDSALELRDHGVAVVSLWPGLVKTEHLMSQATTLPDGRVEMFGLDLGGAEWPRFTGRAVVALATDPTVLEQSGQSLIPAQLARDHGFTDIDGNLPPVVRGVQDLLGAGDDVPEFWKDVESFGGQASETA
jgi:NAD(P)-dependent dehydrogenase (short-subunit alcohol dehydrogenase family)